MDGKGPQPIEHFVGRVVQEIPALKPSEVFEEVGRLPVGFLGVMLEMRAYAETKGRYDAEAKANAGVEPEMLTLVKQIESEIAREEMARERDADHGRE